MSRFAESIASTSGRSPVWGVFRAHADAELAYAALLALGYEGRALTVVLSTETQRERVSGPEAEPGGAPLRGAAGALVVALLALGTAVALPGIVLLLAGPRVTSFVSADEEGAGGTLRGALLRAGLPEESARAYAQALREGSLLLSVDAEGPEGVRRAGDAMRRARAEHLYEASIDASVAPVRRSAGPPGGAVGEERAPR